MENGFGIGISVNRWGRRGRESAFRILGFEASDHARQHRVEGLKALWKYGSQYIVLENRQKK